MTSCRWPLLALLVVGCGPGLQMASLGDVVLENGEIVRDCRVGYRTFGELDPDRSNAVLLLPWFMGSSADLARQVGPGLLVDSTRYFVIAVDSIGNGVSTSPSNSLAQRGAAFPSYSLRDMVAIQHTLVTRTLGLSHLRAVVGISMGASQAFEWVTSYSDFAGAAVAVVGTPRVTPRDRATWQAKAQGFAEDGSWSRAVRAIREGRPHEVVREWTFDPSDGVRQFQALMSTDVARSFNGSLERAAAVVRARMLIVVSRTDAVLDPSPAIEFAATSRAQLIELDGRCGHRAPSCESGTLRAAVGRFLEGP